MTLDDFALTHCFLYNFKVLRWLSDFYTLLGAGQRTLALETSNLAFSRSSSSGTREGCGEVGVIEAFCRVELDTSGSP